MRKLNTLAVALIALIAVALAGCSNAPAASDPYQVLYDANGKWDTVQVNVGLSVQGGDTPLTLDPSAVKFVVDSNAGKALIHVSLPLDQLQVDATTLSQLGITGNTLDLDVLWDGDALYAKAPALKNAVTLMLMQAGQTVSGDLGGWMRLATKQEFEALAGFAGGGVTPSMAPMPSAASAADLKAKAEAAGLVLTLAGTEQHAGVDANHVKFTLDWSKFAQSEFMKGVEASQAQAFLGAMEGATVTGDIWLDRSAKRVVGVDIHGAGKAGEKVDVTVTAKSPDAGTSFTAPSDAVSVPLMGMITQLMAQFGGSLGAPTTP
jgi:hypothetical protein